MESQKKENGVVAEEEEKKSSLVAEEIPQEQKLMKQAYEMKDEGNFYFKQKDYKKAISKYCRVQLYVKPLAPAPAEGGADVTDPTLAMVQGMKQFSISDEDTK